MANDSLDVLEALIPTAKLATQTLTRGVDIVHQEEMVIGDGVNDGRIVAVTIANALKVDSSAAVQPVSDNGGAITVDALNLDIRNLTTGQDKVDVRLRDAADTAFIDPVIKGQLPAALVGGRLSVDASGVAVPITDNAGSITVDGTVTTAPPANASENLTQFGGTNVSTGVGASGAGIPRVTVSNDSVIAEQRAATLHVTATAAVNTGSTCTLPAPGAGLFHYITNIELVKLYSVVGVANAAGVVVTSTNLPGNPSWLTEQAVGPAGTAPKVILYSPATPLKSLVANTATTLVAGAQLQTIWRWNVSYFTAA